MRSRRTAAPARRSLDWQADDKDTGAWLKPARGMIGYGVLFVVALLFTQLLRSRVSHLFFWFMLLLLPVLLLYTLIARTALKVYLDTERSDVEKGEPCPYELRIINASPLAYPFVEALVRVPRADAVRTMSARMRTSLPPLGSCSLRNEVRFRFRGTYEIGVKCFYVYDFFRIWCVRVDVDEYHNVLVLPRRRQLSGETGVARSDMAQTVTQTPFCYDRSEVRDVREYRLGDAIRDVHWKLSSKAEELLVRDYSGGSSDRTILYCDLSARYPTPPVQTEEEQSPSTTRRSRREELLRAVAEQERRRRERASRAREDLADWTAVGERDRDLATVATDDPDIRALDDGEELKKSARRVATAGGNDTVEAPTKASEPESPAAPDPLQPRDADCYLDGSEYGADGVVELTVALALRELRAGRSCLLMWFDARAELGAFGFELHEAADLESIYRLFATAPLTAPDNGVGKLRAMLGDTQGIKQIIVTAALDRASMSEICDIPGVSGSGETGATTLVYYAPEERFANPCELRLYLEGCRRMLAEKGVDMVDGTPYLSGEGVTV